MLSILMSLQFFLYQSPSTQVPQEQAAKSAPGADYENSSSGIQQQFQDFLRIVRSNDQTAVQGFLDSFAVPNAEQWFSENFSASNAAQLAVAYKNAFAGVRSHIWWATGKFAEYPDFSYRVESSEPPKAPVSSGFESLFPRPLIQTSIENYRIGSASTISSHGPPSWVSSFVYLAGRFRWVGGTYPFWAEGLTQFRGPMSLPPREVHGRVVQAIAFRDDQKTPGIDSVVQLQVKVERDGHISRIKVLSGDSRSVEDAKEYLSNVRFQALPNDPRLADAERVWKLEVAFFSPH